MCPFRMEKADNAILTVPADLYLEAYRLSTSLRYLCVRWLCDINVSTSFLRRRRIRGRRRQYVLRSSTRPSSKCISCNAISSTRRDFDYTLHKYSSCQLALLNKFSRSELTKGQGRDQTECCNGEGMHFQQRERYPRWNVEEKMSGTPDPWDLCSYV